jgi:hypothetical protein
MVTRHGRVEQHEKETDASHEGVAQEGDERAERYQSRCFRLGKERRRESILL